MKGCCCTDFSPRCVSTSYVRCWWWIKALRSQQHIQSNGPLSCQQLIVRQNLILSRDKQVHLIYTSKDGTHTLHRARIRWKQRTRTRIIIKVIHFFFCSFIQNSTVNPRCQTQQTITHMGNNYLVSASWQFDPEKSTCRRFSATVQRRNQIQAITFCHKASKLVWSLLRGWPDSKGTSKNLHFLRWHFPFCTGIIWLWWSFTYILVWHKYSHSVLR